MNFFCKYSWKSVFSGAANKEIKDAAESNILIVSCGRDTRILFADMILRDFDGKEYYVGDDYPSSFYEMINTILQNFLRGWGNNLRIYGYDKR